MLLNFLLRRLSTTASTRSSQRLVLVTERLAFASEVAQEASLCSTAHLGLRSALHVFGKCAYVRLRSVGVVGQRLPFSGQVIKGTLHNSLLLFAVGYRHRNALPKRDLNVCAFRCLSLTHGGFRLATSKGWGLESDLHTSSNKAFDD